MITLVDVLVVVMPVLYAGLVGVYAVSFFGNSTGFDRYKTPLLLITVAIHSIYILVRTVAFDHPPAPNALATERVRCRGFQ